MKIKVVPIQWEATVLTDDDDEIEVGMSTVSGEKAVQIAARNTLNGENTHKLTAEEVENLQGVAEGDDEGPEGKVYEL